MGRKYCIVKSCTSRSDKQAHLSFHSFPNEQSNADQHKLWKDRLGVDQVPKNAFVCSSHFRESDFIIANQRRILAKHAIPLDEKSYENATHTVTIPSKEANKFVIDINEKKILVIMQPTNHISSQSAYQASPIQRPSKPKATNVAKLQKKVKILQTALAGSQVGQKKAKKSNKKWKSAYTKVLKKSKCKISSRMLRKAVSTAKKEVHGFYHMKLRTIFSENQVNRLISDKNSPYSSEEIADAIALRYKANTYEELIARNFPFPSSRTICRKVSKIRFQPGLLHPVLELLKSSFHHSGEMERQCVMSYDEVSIDPKFDYDQINDRILGGHSSLQVIIIRGLFYEWKQIIAYNFDETLTAETFLEYIRKVEDVGLVVRAVVSDLGPKNQSLMKKLGIYVKYKDDDLEVRNSFDSPTDGHNIYYFADVPHMIKLLRNHIVNTQVRLPNGGRINKRDLEHLVNIERSNDMKESFKLTLKDINLQGKDKMRVGPALHVFTPAVAQHWLKVFPSRTEEADYILDIYNGWCVMTGRHCNFSERIKLPYGQAFDTQKPALDKFSNAFLKIRVGTQQNLLPFQMGILLSTKSLDELYIELSASTMRISYIMGSHLTQDAVENLFCQFRSLRGFAVNPTALDATRRIKLLMLSSCKTISRASNVSLDNSMCCLTGEMLDSLIQASETDSISFSRCEELASNIIGTGDDSLVDAKTSELVNMQTLVHSCKEGGLEHFCARLASELKVQYPYMAASPQELHLLKGKSWILSLQQEHLTVPSVKWQDEARKLNKDFESFVCMAGSHFGVSSTFSKTVSQKYPTLDKNIINAFTRVRMRVQIGILNNNLENEKVDKSNEKERRKKALQNSINYDFQQHCSFTLIQSHTEESSEILTNTTGKGWNIFDSGFPQWSDKVDNFMQTFFPSKNLFPIQRQGINAAGHDVILIAGTGRGKSLVYQICATISLGLTVVVSPLSALIMDQLKSLQKLGISSRSLHETEELISNEDELFAELRKSSAVKVLLLTPERLANSIKTQNFLVQMNSEKRLDRFVIDEVHCVHNWISFRPAFKYLGNLKEKYEGIPVIAMSATLPNMHLKGIQNQLGLHDAVVLRDDWFPFNIHYVVAEVPSGNKLDILHETISGQFSGKSGIVYCLTIKDCESTAKWLQSKGISAAAFHSGLDVRDREIIINRWMSQTVPVIVSTTALGMGVDNPNCRYVVHTTLPESMSSFIQEAGRCGRDGNTAKSVILYTFEDIFRALSLYCLDKKSLDSSMQVLKFMLNADDCRTTMLSKYLGINPAKKNCFCDNCTGISYASYDAAPVFTEIVKILERLETLRMKQTPNKLLDLIYGKSSDVNIDIDYQIPDVPKDVTKQILLHGILEGLFRVTFNYSGYRTFSYIELGLKRKSLRHALIYKIKNQGA